MGAARVTAYQTEACHDRANGTSAHDAKVARCELPPLQATHGVVAITAAWNGQLQLPKERVCDVHVMMRSGTKQEHTPAEGEHECEGVLSNRRRRVCGNACDADAALGCVLNVNAIKAGAAHGDKPHTIVRQNVNDLSTGVVVDEQTDGVMACSLGSSCSAQAGLSHGWWFCAAKSVSREPPAYLNKGGVGKGVGDGPHKLLDIGLG